MLFLLKSESKSKSVSQNSQKCSIVDYCCCCCSTSTSQYFSTVPDQIPNQIFKKNRKCPDNQLSFCREFLCIRIHRLFGNARVGSKHFAQYTLVFDELNLLWPSDDFTKEILTRDCKISQMALEWQLLVSENHRICFSELSHCSNPCPSR